jgi:hypothetical protein
MNFKTLFQLSGFLSLMLPEESTTKTISALLQANGIENDVVDSGLDVVTDDGPDGEDVVVTGGAVDLVVEEVMVVVVVPGGAVTVDPAVVTVPGMI